MPTKPFYIFLLAASLFSPLSGQNRITQGAVMELYTQLCASCHGARGEGGLGGSLVDDEWISGGDDASIARSISAGNVEKGMPPYGEVFDDEQLRAIVVLIRELGHESSRAAAPPPPALTGKTIKSKHHDFIIEEVLRIPEDAIWSVNFLPDGKLILAGFAGNLFIAEDGGTPSKIDGIPEVWRHGQGGLMDVVPHPDYEKNGWVYMSFAESSGTDKNGKKVGATRIVRGRIDGGRWVDEENIFRSDPSLHTTSGGHFGCRIAFKDGYLFFTHGERGNMNNAQNLTNPFGKVHRLHEDGRVPRDNPFADNEDAVQSIWTYGNRNAQGLEFCSVTGHLWSTEHGPRGGDELNWIRPGLNYGWPVITHGINYNGKPISDRTEAPGMEQPAHYWTPSIAVCGMDIVNGEAFPKWKGHVLTGGLASQELHRVGIEGTKVLDREVLFKGIGRVRDVGMGPDGLVYLAINKERHSEGHIFRLRPAD